MKTCKCGKKCYPSKKAANYALLGMWKRGRDERRSYRCDRNKSVWHLTSMRREP